MRSSGVNSSPVAGLADLEHERVLVVRHRLGGIDLTLDERDHVAALLHRRHVGRVDAGLGEAGEDLVLVAEAPVADVWPAKSAGDVIPESASDSCSVPERWRIWAMCTMSAPASRVCQRLGHPRRGEVRTTVGEHLLWHDVDSALEDLDVEAVVGVDSPPRRPRRSRRTVPG